MSRIVRRDSVFQTRWFEILEKTVEGQPDPFYSVKLYPYVSVLALREDGKIPLVRQFRAVVEDYTWELPSGHVEQGETPEQAGHRELLEESGYTAKTFELMGKVIPDNGRLETTLWCYFATDLSESTTGVTEEGIEVGWFDSAELLRKIADGLMLQHALDLSLVSLALTQGKLRL